MMLPDDLLKRISKLGDKTDEITEKMLEAGGEVALAKVRDSLDSVMVTIWRENPALQAS